MPEVRRRVLRIGTAAAAVFLTCGWSSVASAQEPGDARRVEWADPGPWTAEFGLMGGPSLSLEEGGVGGFGSARAGFRHQRRRHRGGDFAEGAAVVMFGNQIGLDLQGDVLGGRRGGQEWALTVHPVFGVALPDRRARAAVRVPALFGPFALGLGGVGGKVGFVVQLNPRVSLLVTRRFGIDLRGMLNVNFKTGAMAVIGLGGFIR